MQIFFIIWGEFQGKVSHSTTLSKSHHALLRSRDIRGQPSSYYPSPHFNIVFLYFCSRPRFSLPLPLSLYTHFVPFKPRGWPSCFLPAFPASVALVFCHLWKPAFLNPKVCMDFHSIHVRSFCFFLSLETTGVFSILNLGLVSFAFFVSNWSDDGRAQMNLVHHIDVLHHIVYALF